jgi:NAD(P)H dehydrogenase (quinone)
MTRLAIVYYSSFGTGHAMASRMAETAEAAGAEVRLRRVRETAPDEVVQGVDAWAAHAASVADEPVA